MKKKKSTFRKKLKKTENKKQKIAAELRKMEKKNPM